MNKGNFIAAVLLLAGLLFGKDKNSTFELNVFFTNDIHGGITEMSADFLNPEFPPMLGRGASAAAVIKKQRKITEEKGDAWLTIDSGDIFQGTLVGTCSKGKAIIEFMNTIGYDVVCPGNHEFDLGAENLRELIAQSNFPWLSCNIMEKATGKLWQPLTPYIIKEIKGVRIGFAGTTTATTESMSFPENVKGLHFLPEIPALQKVVDKLRNEEKVDLVVGLVHNGLPYDRKEGYKNLQQTTYEGVLQRGYANGMEIAHYVKGIDFLLTGHIHKGYQEPWEDPVTHTVCVQTYGNGTNLGWIIIEIDKETKSIKGFRYPADKETMLLLQEDEFWPDSLVAVQINAQQKIYEKGFSETIGRTQTALIRAGVGESPMYNLITDAMRARLKADFSFTNFGGIRSDLKVGNITKQDIFKVLPFGNQLVEFQADGKFLKKIIEEKVKGNRRGMAVSGVKIIYSKSLPDGQRVVNLLINGKPLQADKRYRVVTSDYLMEGNSGLSILKTINSELVAYTGILMRDAVIEYVNEHSPLRIEVEGRWEKDNNAKPSPQWIKQFEEPQGS